VFSTRIRHLHTATVSVTGTAWRIVMEHVPRFSECVTVNYYATLVAADCNQLNYCGTLVRLGGNHMYRQPHNGSIGHKYRPGTTSSAVTSGSSTAKCKYSWNMVQMDSKQRKWYLFVQMPADVTVTIMLYTGSHDCNHKKCRRERHKRFVGR